LLYTASPGFLAIVFVNCVLMAPPSLLSTRFRLYLHLVRLDKPIGILLLLWPTLWALWIASAGQPHAALLVIFVLGTVLMRSAGCALNDVVDHNVDRHVERTRNRPITSGKLSRREGVLVAGVLTLLAALLILPLNGLVWLLAGVAAFIAGTYPYTKRFFPLPQAYLGIAFGFGIPMAFAAVQETVPTVAWVMLLANVFWALAYDTEYAMVDREDDLRIGIKTAAITFGRFDVLAVMACYGMSLVLLGAAGAMTGRGLGYGAGLCVAGVIALYHHRLIRTRSRAGCFRAFRHNNWFGAAIFAGLVLDYLL
jgi:4-hydroxybenzoate polyprenyltransferase